MEQLSYENIYMNSWTQTEHNHAISTITVVMKTTKTTDTGWDEQRFVTYITPPSFMYTLVRFSLQSWNMWDKLFLKETELYFFHYFGSSNPSWITLLMWSLRMARKLPRQDACRKNRMRSQEAEDTLGWTQSSILTFSCQNFLESLCCQQRKDLPLDSPPKHHS